MGIENECRKLNIDMLEMCSICENLGAKKVGIFEQKRFVYDFIPEQKGKWIRLRTNGKNSTLTIKEIKTLQIDGTKELEIAVSDFNMTNEILNKLGYNARLYQENFRIEYKLNGITFDIDMWPGIPPYIEIEGNTKADVYRAIELLKWKQEDVTVLDTEKIYNQIYSIDLNSIKDLRFSEKEKEYIEKVRSVKND